MNIKSQTLYEVALKFLYNFTINYVYVTKIVFVVLKLYWNQTRIKIQILLSEDLGFIIHLLL